MSRELRCAMIHNTSSRIAIKRDICLLCDWIIGDMKDKHKKAKERVKRRRIGSSTIKFFSGYCDTRTISTNQITASSCMANDSSRSFEDTRISRGQHQLELKYLMFLLQAVTHGADAFRKINHACILFQEKYVLNII